MKPLFVASVAALALSNVAHADSYYSATCGSSILSVGTYSKDRDVRVSVVYDHGAWRVAHTLSNGHVYERGVQYDLRDQTSSFNDGTTKPTWTGVLRRNSSISMTGSLGMRGATLTYDETMVQGGKTILASEATCALDRSSQPPASPPVVTAYGPAASDRVPVSVINNQAHIAVSLGSLPVPMLVDTGCTYMTVTESIADQLLASGQATRAEDGQSTLADGSTHTQASIIINNMTVGGQCCATCGRACLLTARRCCWGSRC
jgi:Aspartyl protease